MKAATATDKTTRLRVAAKKSTRPLGDRGQGRKPIPDDQRLKVGSLRMSQAQWDKLDELAARDGLPSGAAWIRVRIDRAKEAA